ncbi:mitochondrial carrier [Diplocarpon rosae]|nr:mitochondrial carrier [Diplocarpon rosae]
MAIMAATATPEFESESSQSFAAKANGTEVTDAVEDIIFGSIAGVAGKYIEYPFDTVKVRLQSQPDHLPLRYTGPLDCFRHVTLLFRHLNSKNTLISSLPKREHQNLAIAPSPSLPPLPLWQQALAGASAGMSYNFLFFPADTIKSRMQTVTTSSTVQQVKFWGEGVAIWRRYGVRGLYRGCGITVMRSAPSSAFIFIIFDALKGHFHSE